MNSLVEPALTMSSREIAELTGKEHKNVIRTVKDHLNLNTVASGLITMS